MKKKKEKVLLTSVNISKMCRIFILAASIFFLNLDIPADSFSFCPKGYFSTETGNVVFKEKNFTSDSVLKFPGDKYIQFSGPIFPGYKLGKSPEVNINTKEHELTIAQKCKENGASVSKEYKLFNGGIKAKISYSEKEFTKPVKYRILFPVKAFSGKSFAYDGKKEVFPVEKSSKKVMLRGKGNGEFRFQISSGLEIGVKFISGVKSFVVSDCRHHGKPESRYHLYLNMEGKTLEYFVCVLNPGQPFPSLDKKQADNSSNKAKRKNILFPGADFEIGPSGCRPFCYYSWNEGWTSPGIQPVFDDKEKYQGKYSLRLTTEDIKKKLGRFNMNYVFFTPVRLDPNKTYTFSAWLKTDVDDMKVIMTASEPWCDNMKKRFNVDKKWKRYSWTFKPEKFKHLNFRYMRIEIFGGISKGSLWIDSVQLEEGGKESEYEPIPLEFGASINQPYKLYNVTELNDAAINLYFRNNSNKEADFKIKYRITDYWDKEVAAGSVDEKVKADGNAERLLKIPSNLPIGYYRVNFDSADGKLHDEAIFGIYKEMTYKGFLPFDWPLGCNSSEGNPIVRKLGFGWVRCWNFNFKEVLPEEDKCDFAKQNVIVKRCQDAKLNIMPILGHALCRTRHHKDGNKFIPKWAIEKTAKSSKKRSWAVDVSFPRIDAWKAYVKAVVSRYKDSIKVWEVMNEPNCWLIPEEYAPYMKATYEAAKEADPDCIIVGVCATSDWSGEPAPWTKRVLEIDGCKSLDALSIHMYGPCSPESYRGIGTDGMLNHLKGILKEFGRDIPIWHTEKSFNTTEMGYSPEKLNFPGVYLRESNFKVPNFRNKAEYMIRESLIDSSVGKGPYFWFGALPNDIYIMPNYNAFGLHHTEIDGSPCPELIAANGLARMLEGREKPQELIKLGASIYCALYQGEKGTLAAVWDSEKKAELKIKSKDAPFKLYNFFGVQLPQSNDLKLTSCPLYLTFDGKKADEIKALLIDSEISGEKFSFSGGLELNDGMPGIAAYLFNRTMKNIKAGVAISGIPAQWKLQENEMTRECAPNKYNRFFFPASLPESSSEPVKIKLSADKQSSELSLIPYDSLSELKAVLSDAKKADAFEAGKIKIDGDLSDWSAAGFSESLL